MDFRSLRVGFASALLLSVALAVGCSSSGNDSSQAVKPGNDGGGSNESSSIGASKGDIALGDACAGDKDCVDGLRCLAPLIGGTERYCASPCAKRADCDAFENSSYKIGVPLTANAQFGDTFTNQWNTTTLSRAVTCAPAGGKQGEPSFCQFGCPPFSAAILDDKGQPNNCLCLPGYQTTADKTGCEPRPEQLGACSVFGWASTEVRDQLKQRYGIETNEPVCDACNSDMSDTDGANCHTGQFMCAMSTRGLNGRCIEVLSVNDLFACVNQSLYQNCDCNCPVPEACNGNDCACCVCTQTGTPTPRPVCKDPGGNGTGCNGAGGTSAAGGATTGTAGGTSVAGHGSSGGASNGGTGSASAGAGSGTAGGTGVAGHGSSGGASNGGSGSSSAGSGSASAGAGHASAGAGTGGAGGHAPP